VAFNRLWIRGVSPLPPSDKASEHFFYVEADAPDTGLKGEYLRSMPRSHIDWLVGIVCIFKACTKLAEIIDAMLHSKFQSEVSAVDLGAITAGYEAMPSDIVL
jgi:hypothetical protein